MQRKMLFEWCEMCVSQRNIAPPRLHIWELLLSLRKRASVLFSSPHLPTSSFISVSMQACCYDAWKGSYEEADRSSISLFFGTDLYGKIKYRTRF
ncbi:Uncharacterized protein TCM_031623 [Theobroma cacao]|uniref:Uncharacterized protein n=1 Tax=Theobroma cacao TaxID=3641 RepID=A0A061F6W1_THECC|nr:Uncharacterized protein TCM_031623 [Theobroma cacao]